jgi:hypothetical protein
MSWDRTWRAIDALIEQAIDRRTTRARNTRHGVATAGIPSLAALE